MAQAKESFWTLYWGPLAAVEDVGMLPSQDAEVEAAMVELGKKIKLGGTPEDMRSLSLSLAHAIRRSIKPAFGLELARSRSTR